jgi:hypothetical protein
MAKRRGSGQVQGFEGLAGQLAGYSPTTDVKPVGPAEPDPKALLGCCGFTSELEPFVFARLHVFRAWLVRDRTGSSLNTTPSIGSLF